MTKKLHVQTLKNGMTLIVEEEPRFQTFACELLLPGGYLFDDKTSIGRSLYLSELMERGAGDLDSKALSDEWESIGARFGLSVGLDRTVARVSCLKDYIDDAFKLFTINIIKPTLPEEEIEPIKSSLLQELLSLQDNPSRKTLVTLADIFYPAPWNRSSYGTKEGFESVTRKDLVDIYNRIFRPSKAVLSIAGGITKEKAIELAENFCRDWQGDSATLPEYPEIPEGQIRHIQQDSHQVQIAFGYPSCKFGDKRYYPAKVANEVLSGGMFGRLFIEVREKRGLCYSVYSRHSGTKYIGSVFAYAGTTPERAQETLDVMFSVLKNLKGTVTEAELVRSRINIKSNLVLSEEGPGSRASSNAGDYYTLGRIRTLDEICREIDNVTLDSVNSYLEEFSPTVRTIVTLGPKELVIPN